MSHFDSQGNHGWAFWNFPLRAPAQDQKLGAMQFAICNEIFQGWPLEQALACAARLGYRAMELAPFTLAPSVTEISRAERETIRAAAARHGLEIAGLHWVLAKPEGLYLNHPDRDIRVRTAQYLCDLVDFCADVGGTRIVVGSPKQRNVLPGVSPAKAWAWARETYYDAVELAANRHVTLCLEPLGAAETNFINTAAEAIEFVGQFSSMYFKIVLDVKAMCAEAKPIPQIIRESWPHFAHFHANDRNLKGPGFGAVDFQPIAAALKEVGYHGFVSVEVFDLTEGPEAIASGSLEYLKRVFD
jgi:sugar phosphate isomerase/epimerase